MIYPILVIMCLCEILTCGHGRKKQVKSKVSWNMLDARYCDDTNVVGNVTLSFKGLDDYRLDISFNTEGSSYNKIAGRTVIMKCPNKGSYVDCQEFVAIPVPNMCKDGFQAKEGVLHIFTTGWRPPMRCPVKGYYEATDLKTSEILALLPINDFVGNDTFADSKSVYVMRIFLESLAPVKKIFWCFQTEGQFILVRDSS